MSKTIYFECTNPECLKGAKGYYTEKGREEQNKVSIELKDGDYVPTFSGSPLEQNCPDCYCKTLIKR